MSKAIRNKSYGPFDVIGEVRGEGRVFLSLPFTDVAGAQVLVSLKDNFAQQAAQFVPSHEWPGVEVTIWGAIQGYEVVIKRQCVHMQTGPMSKVFDYADGWDTILFRARNMNGGNQQGQLEMGVPPFPIQENGFALQTTVNVMPRSGFASPSSGGGQRSGSMKVG